MKSIKSLVIAAVVVLAGCQSTVDAPKDVSLIEYQFNPENINAVVANPYPSCEKSVSIARLDKKPEEIVFLDIDSGSVCK